MTGYYNTTNLSGSDLTRATEKAQTQEEVILAWFRSLERPNHGSAFYGLSWGPSKVRHMCLNHAPITSVRRAMNSLTKKGKLEKTTHKVDGPYGAQEFTWRLKP